VLVGSVEFPDQFFGDRAAIVSGCHLRFSPRGESLSGRKD
jgi:hypothetical protein